MPVLVVKGLASPPRFHARDLELGPAELVVVAGPTGSGKSSFLRAIADLDEAASGTVSWQGAPRSDCPAPLWRSRVMYVGGETPPLAPTVAADLARARSLGPDLMEATQEEAPEREASDHGDPLDGFPALEAGRDTARLSTGETQLLALQRALVRSPSVLLLDEPTSSMDPELARKTERFLLAWLGPERAILWISHDPGLPARLGTRTIRFP